MTQPITKQQVEDFLPSIFVLSPPVSGNGGPTPHSVSMGGGGSGVLPLKLHPRVDAFLPGVHAQSAEQLHSALAAYRALLSGVSLSVLDVVVTGDTALVIGEQVIRSRLEDAGQLLAHRLSPHLVELAGHYLPSFQDARVPTAVALTFGKNDAGDPVVTKMSVVFNLPSAICPHLRLAPWQAALAKQAGDGLLSLMQSAGKVAAVAEDAWIAAAAAWRAGGALGQPALENVLELAWTALKQGASVAFEAMTSPANGASREEEEGTAGGAADRPEQPATRPQGVKE